MTTPGSALFTDLYEVTMVDAHLRAGTAGRPATFSLFVRDLPPGRGYLVAAGLDDALRWLEDLAFGPAELAALAGTGLVGDEALDLLGSLRFTGTVRAVPEGTVVFGGEPILEVDAPIEQAQLAETYLLNQVTLQTVLASKAARFREAAGGRALLEFGSRRSHGTDAAAKLARCSRLAGFVATSNVEAAQRYGLAVSGTMAHSFVQAALGEREAFRAMAAATGAATVLLVDTYDTERGLARAVEVARELRAAGVEVRGVRLDAGDLATLAGLARRRLDEAGFPGVQVVASGGLDEHRVAALVAAGAPIDAFGVGTALAVSADAPTLDSVYKLVAFDGRGVRKTSEGKATLPGAKQVWRRPGWRGDVVALAGEPAPEPGAEALLVEVVRDGERTAAGRADLAAAAARFERSWASLPAGVRRLTHPDRYPVEVSGPLRRLADLPVEA